MQYPSIFKFFPEHNMEGNNKQHKINMLLTFLQNELNISKIKN